MQPVSNDKRADIIAAKQLKDEKLGAFLNFYADYYFKTI